MPTDVDVTVENSCNDNSSCSASVTQQKTRASVDKTPLHGFDDLTQEDVQANFSDGFESDK